MRNYYEKIEGEMFDFKSYYQKIAEDLPDNCRVMEVGLASGKSCIFLAEAILNLGKKIEKFVAVDNCAYGGQDQRNEIIRNLVLSGMGEVIEFWEMGSLDASCKLPDGYLHHCFIDSSHKHQQTKAEIRLYYRKMIHGARLSGHDYYSKENPEVQQAVIDSIPVSRLETFQTELGNGIWSIIKDDNLSNL